MKYEKLMKSLLWVIRENGSIYSINEYNHAKSLFALGQVMDFDYTSITDEYVMLQDLTEKNNVVFKNLTNGVYSGIIYLPESLSEMQKKFFNDNEDNFYKMNYLAVNKFIKNRLETICEYDPKGITVLYEEVNKKEKQKRLTK